VPGWVSFIPLVDNEHADKPGYQDAEFTRETVNENGDFSILVMPGAGVLTMQAKASGPRLNGEHLQIYRMARFSAEDRPRITFNDEKQGMFLTPGRTIRNVISEHYVKYVDFAPDARRQRLDFQLDRGKTVDVEFVDAAGKPVENVFVSGIAEHDTAQLEESRTTIVALAAATPRRIIGVETKRGLLGSVTLTGEERSPVRIVLGASASFRGRAVDEHGQPLADQNLLVNFDDDSVRYLYYSLPEQNWTITTGKDGAFEMRHVVSDQPIHLTMRVDGGWLETTAAVPKTGLKPGQHVDLGNVTFLPYDRVRAMKANP
jgi:hypothetical protein